MKYEEGAGEDTKSASVNPDLKKLTATAQFTIGSASLVESIEIVDSEGVKLENLTLKDTSPNMQLYARVLPDNENVNRTVSWAVVSSEPKNCVSIKTGDYLSVSEAGTATITATATDGSGVYAECEVTVVPSVTDVNFYSSNESVPLAALEPGDTFQLKPTFTPANAGTQTGKYESSDTDVVTVDGDGEVTAVAHGAAFVTFTANDGDGQYYAPLLFCVLDPDVTGSGSAASVNGVEYGTLEAAVEAGAGQTITLLRNQEAGVITLPAGSTLDLNGRMLYVSSILIPEDTAVVSIENGTIIGKWGSGAAVLLSNDSSLESLDNVKIMCAQQSAVSSDGTENVAWKLGSVTDCDITVIFSDPEDKINTWNADCFSVFDNFSSGDIFYIGGDTRVKAIGCTLAGGGYRRYGDVFIYGGQFDVPRIKTGGTVVHIYGGSYRNEITELAMGGTDDIYGVEKVGDWWVVTKGGTPTTLTVNADPATAQITLHKLDGDTKTPVTVTSSTGGQFVFPVELQYSYEYRVTADGYAPASGVISITSKDKMLSVALRLDSVTPPATDVERTETISGGTVITEGGTYRLAPPVPDTVFGVITVATRAPVRLIGYGITDQSTMMYRDLTIECAAGANLIIRDIWTNNNRGKGTPSGATNMGVNILDFTGKGNALTIEGVNLLENQEYVAGAGIHVAKGAELTFQGAGTMYLYKYSQGCGIGGNAGEASGRLEFASGEYFIKGSKTGAVIGGDGMGDVIKNDNIIFSGASVTVANVATGAAIGDSNSRNCAGDVYLTGGSLTTFTEFMGPAIGKTGRLFVTGGSLKAVMTSNAVGPGYGLDRNIAPGLYVRDESIMAAKLNGAGQEVSLLKFDTAQLKTRAASFTVTGAITYSGGLHATGYDMESTNTITSFPADNTTDTNLYFYLPKAADQELIVNKEKFTVSWDSDTAAFTVKNESGAVISTSDANSSKEADKPETAAKTDTTVKDGEATVVVAVPDKDAQTTDTPERLVVNVDTKGENVDKITVEIPKEVIALESGSKSEIEIRSEVANVLIPEKAVAALAVTGEAVTVKAAKNDDASYTFTVAAGEKNIEKLDGGIKAVISSEDATPGTVAVIVHADGTEEVIKKSVGKDGKVSIPLDGSATIKIVDNSKAFADVSSNAWYSDGVKFTSSHELFQGTDNGGFAPEMSMTRGMLATVLHRLENAPTATGDLFSDVAGDAYYAEAIIWASANSIVNGTGDGFAPDAEINREQLTVMLYRYYVWTFAGDGGRPGTVAPTDANLSAFPDADGVSEWAEDAVIWAVGIGLINGRDSGLAPQGTATRAEVAVILERFIENVL
ncbi:MAG: S-layer homology domain-containing protein [Oscillospiraceae bacterium]|nr:S-layer homology domain-containing protein [Oscillospiraceae bacterium]